MSYHNHWEEKGLYRVFSNKISGEEILRSNLELHGHPRFTRLGYVINDFLNIAEFEISNLDVLKVSTLDNVATQTNDQIKIAIVATDEALLHWIHQYMKQMTDSPYPCKIFATVDDAQQWVATHIGPSPTDRTTKKP